LMLTLCLHKLTESLHSPPPQLPQYHVSAAVGCPA
jgi:hypothetical protein